MKWKKRGVIYKPDGALWWARTHAQAPTPFMLSEDVIRIYVSCWDDKKIARVGFIDVSAKDPTQIVAVAREPVLDLGRPGTFDDNGIVATSALRAQNGLIFLYYSGFELSSRVRYRLLSGLAISTDGLRFARAQETPVLERSSTELYFRANPSVIREDGRYRMWYSAGSTWMDLAGKSMPVYDLRYAESLDGINWPSEGKIVLPVSETDEHGLARPCVFRNGPNWELFYSVRRKSLRTYRMGYAVSADGMKWDRRDAGFGLEPSHDGWDALAVSYGIPLRIGDRTWLFYNGNNFGETGVGVALREQ